MGELSALSCDCAFTFSSKLCTSFAEKASGLERRTRDATAGVAGSALQPRCNGDVPGFSTRTFNAVDILISLTLPENLYDCAQ